MVAAECNAGTADCCVVIRPNCSLSWRGTLTVFCSISLVSLAIALGFASLGLWMVLPFAGLELGLLGYALWRCARRSQVREVISIHGGEIAVQRGCRMPEETTCLQRGWARVELARPTYRGYPSRLLIRSHGREVEVGGCLNEAERRRLAEDLRHWVNLLPASLSAA
ncbi:MAG: DUF2244 domain-containing protein [Thiohalobacteraceae bacterium]